MKSFVERRAVHDLSCLPAHTSAADYQKVYTFRLTLKDLQLRLVLLAKRYVRSEVLKSFFEGFVKPRNCLESNSIIVLESHLVLNSLAAECALLTSLTGAHNLLPTLNLTCLYTNCTAVCNLQSTLTLIV